ncbi:MAG: 1-acyl-sn-glycerol-3-phosphate acyltransferase [Polyangiaceae bacterium]|nr:1-acyl-sn-glycerol-3-phosphate acyltransferase [Polyangiaceae bacterium]MCW5789127.1 1-acyl-sn-glycerol-3-phosphate acyltransferase [Polyangiaceae bacterium]
MLTLPRLESIRLTARPRIQRVVAWGVLFPNYSRLPGITIRFEHTERLPEHPVIFAMNHTDRYNYWPFQYQLYRKLGRYTATWVKGKYYENAFVGRFMELTNNIPTVSRGYLITKDFALTVGRKPRDSEYEALRRWVDESATNPSATLDPEKVPEVLLTRPRDVLGVLFEPEHENYAACINRLFRAMMRRFTELNAETFDKGLDLLVFPEGTRSLRLSRGHIGITQVALKYQKTIVPVGCSGSDKLYPGGSPLAKSGTVTYRFGEPIPYEELAPFHIDEDYEPFSAEAEARHRERFQGAVDVVMDRINDLVDPAYQYSEDKRPQGVDKERRFI